jgi:uncharacterized protein (UPF0332 family)
MDFSSHSQLLGAFNKTFIRTGLLSSNVGTYYRGLFESRQTGDYDIHSHFEKFEAKECLDQLENILMEIRNFVKISYDLDLDAFEG